jgi:hypothetical protein
VKISKKEEFSKKEELGNFFLIVSFLQKRGYNLSLSKRETERDFKLLNHLSKKRKKAFRNLR